MAFLTIFTAPKPFTNPHIALIQRNAIQSWQHLGDEVEVVLIGEEAGLANVAAELGARHLPDVKRNSSGTPLVSSIFDLASGASNSPVLSYINADMLLLPDYLKSAHQAAMSLDRFLIVGQRWDLEVNAPLDFSEGWGRRLEGMVNERGKLHPQGGSDYFIFPRTIFTTTPDFAIGRAGWDNWMIYEAKQRGWPVIDGTQSIRVIHQSHDYSHLPNGQPHYRLPETAENVHLAGGQRTIFTLKDCDYKLINGQVGRVPLTWRRFWRGVEIFPLIKLHSKWLAQLFYAIFHPLKAYLELRTWLRKTNEQRNLNF
jgi:hypothetical protein